MSVVTFRLDPEREITDLETEIISNERAFLEWIVCGCSTSETILLQGRSLCHWAEEWAHGRGITVEQIISPRASWRRWHAQWTDEEILYLQKKSGHLTAPGRWEELLASLFPEGPFSSPLGLEHVSAWALWLELADIQLDSSLRPILKSLTEQWRDSCDENNILLQIAYGLDHSEAASSFLHDWLLESRFTHMFPLPMPVRWQQKAQERWQFLLLEEGCATFWSRFPSSSFHRELRQLAAQLVYSYLSQHPEELTLNLLTSLRPYLPNVSWQELSRVLPPPQPQYVPVEAPPDWVLQWFRDEYLPYRTWQLACADTTSLAQAAPIAESFADWMLHFYPQALGGGTGFNHLAITASARLQQTQGVTLWVILDGLPVSDGDQLRDLLSSEKRFTRAEDKLCFTCLPTITCFCKPALMNGSPPEKQDITETPSPKFESAVVLKDKTMREQVAEAKAGQVLVWSYKEPDATYHKNQSRETTLAEIESQLKLIAHRIQELALCVPDHLPVTVVVSTDHGRVLSAEVPREEMLPADAKSEGRTAWISTKHDVTFDGSAMDLPSDQYRLPEGVKVWVARGSGAFVMSNGAGGKVSFPHGGLWPEEVIVPWFTFIRDAKTPSLRIVISGTGRTGGTGSIAVTATNAESVPITLLKLTVRSVAGEIIWQSQVPQESPALQQKQSEVELTPYPNVEGLTDLVAEAVVAMPSGVKFTLPAEVSLLTDSLYSRGLDAQDLLDL